MSFRKAKDAFNENGRRYLSAKDGHHWNTNAGLLNLTTALESALSDTQAQLARLEQRIQHLEQIQRR